MGNENPADRRACSLAGLRAGRVRGIWRHAEVDCKEVAKLAETLKLSMHRSTRLYLQLCRARSTFDGWIDIYSSPRNSAVAARLNGIEKSILRIVGEARAADRQWDAARSMMEREGEKWAASQNPSELQSLGFRARELGSGKHFGASDIIDRWFSTAPFILHSLRQARARLKNQEDVADQWQGQPGHKEWLIGGRLPKLFEEISGSALRIAKSNNDSVQKAGGVAFVVTAHEAIGLGSISPETVAVHVKNYRRRCGWGVALTEISEPLTPSQEF